jgi:L-lactate dehydrogenase complex protein LldF
MESTSHQFSANAAQALGDPTLRAALARLQHDTRTSRPLLLDRLPEFGALRDAAADIRTGGLDNLDSHLENFERNVLDQGGHVHWCRTDEDACAAIYEICRAHGAKSVVKGKSMVSEEIALNDYLQARDLEVVETDLGEYILQLRGETPSHVVMPAIHLTQDGIAETFHDSHLDLDAARDLTQARNLTDEARDKLRGKFIAADIGITGANFLVAETGTAVIVTNEGNGDLTQTLPPVHIVLASIEKVIPTIADALSLIRVLARSATGQEITCYTTFATGLRRDGDLDGPEEFHVVLLDNGRTDLLDGEFRDILRCIRCGACQSICPVYGAIGGHAYGWVYGGPIGAVLTPALTDLESARDLPDASSLCGACADVCPVKIPIPDLLRRWRRRAHDRKLSPVRARWAISLWAWCANRPKIYRPTARIAMGLLRLAAGKKGRLRRLPFASGWTSSRDFPAPQGGTFMDQWRAK